MRKLFFLYILFCSVSFNSCDDGDVIYEELEFGNTFKACGDSDLVLYKTKVSPAESLSLKLSGVTLNDILDCKHNANGFDIYSF